MAVLFDKRSNRAANKGLVSATLLKNGVPTVTPQIAHINLSTALIIPGEHGTNWRHAMEKPLLWRVWITNKAALEQFEIGYRLTGLPGHVAVIQGPRSQREVHLNTDGKVMVCATIWWNTENISRFLGDVGKPIWINLASKRTETYRDITQLYYGNSPDLERRSGHEGPFWGREYIFRHDGQPLSLIHEVFSPAVEQYLGPMLS